MSTPYFENRFNDRSCSRTHHVIDQSMDLQARALANHHISSKLLTSLMGDGPDAALDPILIDVCN